ncbi:methyltransferase domain-containing protein [Nocardiopsis alba]
MIPHKGDAMNTDYTFDSGTDLGRFQLDHLSLLLDGASRDFIGEVAAHEGQHCLELGAGNGSIAAWLAERVGPTGRVDAVDLDTRHLDGVPGVRVHRHDVREGPPVDGPFDLIHARLLLMHFERRHEFLESLARELAPGGLLVLGEFTRPPTVPFEAPTESEAALYHRLLETTIERIARPAGQDYAWGYEADRAMIRAGLEGVETAEYRHTARGGSATCRLISNYARQFAPALTALGWTEDELDRIHALMSDPRTRIGFFPFVCIRGRRPLDG